MTAERIEPPPNLLSVDRSHYLQFKNVKYYSVFYWSTSQGIEGWIDEKHGDGHYSPEMAARMGLTYICPVPTPAEIAASAAREAALVEALREIVDCVLPDLSEACQCIAREALAAVEKEPTPMTTATECEVCGNEVRNGEGCFNCECPAPLDPDTLREMRDERRRMEREFPMRDEP